MLERPCKVGDKQIDIVQAHNYEVLFKSKNYGESLIAFLGYNHSPKWSKFKNNNFCPKLSYYKSSNKNDNKSKPLKKNNRSPAPDALCSPKGPHKGKRGAGGTKTIYNNKNIFNINKNIPYIQKRFYSNVNNLSKTLFYFIKDKNLTPVYKYENLELKETRNRILQETKGLSGIYLILNKVTLDFYIGSASTGRFNARFSNHLIYLKGSKIVKHAIRKYKLSNFAFLILELFPEVINKENNKKLIDIEDLYLKSMLPNYNILTEAGSSFGYKHTELDRIKMKSNYSLERRLRIGSLNKGKTLTVETIEKIRNKALSKDRTQINISEQSLLNMKKRSKPIILFNLDQTVFGEYSSITDTAKAINCSIKTIIRALKTPKKLLLRRFIVNYIENK